MASGPVLANGRYSLRQRLGAGNFGEVYRARDNIQADDGIVVKLLGQEVTLAEVLLENQLLTRLRQHDRVATIRNVVIEPPMPFIVMDYLSGGSVGARLSAGDVSLVEAVRWTREALDGLAHAHDMGVIHRDVKPRNILLDGNDRAVLSDFGIAEDTVRQILANPAIYLPHKAPELGAQPSSTQSDIWAMGCTLYRLLTEDQLPFATPADAQAGAFTDPHRINPQVPMSVTRVVQKALQVDPAQRYQDAREMLADLVRCEVSYSWDPLPASGKVVDNWRADGVDGEYVLTVTEKRNQTFEVNLTRDLGNRPRSVFKRSCPRRSDANRIRRNCLLAVVAGRLP